MISNKALATLLFITLNMQHAASSGTQEPSSSGKPALVRKQKFTSEPGKEVLRDVPGSTTEDVQVREEGVVGIGAPQRQPAPREKSQLEKEVERDEYRKIFGNLYGPPKADVHDPDRVIQLLKFGKEIIAEKNVGTRTKSISQKQPVPSKHDVHGKTIVDKEAIIKSGVYDKSPYIRGGALETALFQAIENDDCDCFADLLKTRKEITAEKDEQLKLEGFKTSFEIFMSVFTGYLTPEKDNAALRKFLTSHGDELGKKHAYLLDVFCRGLIGHLKRRLDKPGAKNLLADMVGQPSILTSASFAKGFLEDAFLDDYYPVFIKHAWGEAILAGLSIPDRGEELWRVMKDKYPTRFSGPFPPTEKARAAILEFFTTKKELEENWAEMNAKTRFEMSKRLGFIPEPTPATSNKSGSLQSSFSSTFTGVRSKSFPQTGPLPQSESHSWSDLESSSEISTGSQESYKIDIYNLPKSLDKFTPDQLSDALYRLAVLGKEYESQAVLVATALNEKSCDSQLCTLNHAKALVLACDRQMTNLVTVLCPKSLLIDRLAMILSRSDDGSVRDIVIKSFEESDFVTAIDLMAKLDESKLFDHLVGVVKGNKKILSEALALVKKRNSAKRYVETLTNLL